MSKDDERIERLADPALLAKVRDAVPREMQVADAKDVVQRVYEKLLLIDPLPATKDGLFGLAHVMTKHEAIDEFRRQGRRAAKFVDVEGAPSSDREPLGASIPEPPSEGTMTDEQIETLLRVVEGEIAKGRLSEDKRELARMLVDGMTPSQIAKARGVPVGTAKSDASRLRAHIAKYWSVYASTAVIVLVVFAVRLRRPGPESEIGPDTAAMSASAAPSTAPAGSTSRGRSFMDQATLMCADGFYDECEKDLDQAVARNPQFEALPEVKAMRAAIAKWKAQEGAPKPGKFPKAPQ
jgi:RNA polymerase sigma factor (sigma-70 family)